MSDERSAYVVMINDTPMGVYLKEYNANAKVRKLKKELIREQSRMGVLRRAQSFRSYRVEEVPLEE